MEKTNTKKSNDVLGINKKKYVQLFIRLEQYVGHVLRHPGEFIVKLIA